MEKTIIALGLFLSLDLQATKKFKPTLPPIQENQSTYEDSIDISHPSSGLQERKKFKPTLPPVQEEQSKVHTSAKKIENKNADSNKQTADEKTLDDYLKNILTNLFLMPVNNPTLKKLEKENKILFQSRVIVLHQQLMVLAAKLHTKEYLFPSKHSTIVLKKKEHLRLIKRHVEILGVYLDKL